MWEFFSRGYTWREYIYKDIREKFIQSGTAHLLAVSGLHIGAVIGIILYAVNFLKIKKKRVEIFSGSCFS